MCVSWSLAAAQTPASTVCLSCSFSSVLTSIIFVDVTHMLLLILQFITSGEDPPVYSLEKNLSSTKSAPIPNLPASSFLQPSRAASVLQKEAVQTVKILVTRRLKGFLYLSSCDELLFKPMINHDAHKMTYGKKLEAFKAVCHIFITPVSAILLAIHEKKNVNAVRDRYIRLEECRCVDLHELGLFSCRIETAFKADVLLEGLIIRKAEFEENMRVKWY